MAVDPITLQPIEDDEAQALPETNSSPFFRLPQQAAPGDPVQFLPLLPGGSPRGDLPQGPPSSMPEQAPGTLRGLFDQIRQDLAPVIERTLAGEVASSFFRGAVPGAIQTTGQALRGIGFEETGTAVKSAGAAIQSAAPSLFRPSDAAQKQGSWTNIVASAVESFAQSASLSVPAVAATILSGGGAPAVIAAYVLSTPGIYGAAEYQNFLDEAKKAGVPDDVARDPALKSALSEIGFELAQNVLESLLVTKGVSRLAIRGIKKDLRQGIKAVIAPKIKEVALDLAGSAATEGLGEAATQATQEQLRQGVGIDTGQSGVFTAGAAGALAGLMFGSVGKTYTGLVNRSDLRTLASGTANPEERLRVVDRVIERLQQAPEGDVDPEVVTNFANYAGQAVAQGDAIPLGGDITSLTATPRPQAPRSPMMPPSIAVQPRAPVEPPVPGVAGPGIFGNLMFQPPPPIPPSAPTAMDLLRGQTAPRPAEGQAISSLAQPSPPVVESPVSGEAPQPELPPEPLVSTALPPSQPAQIPGSGLEAPASSPLPPVVIPRQPMLPAASMSRPRPLIQPPPAVPVSREVEAVASEPATLPPSPIPGSPTSPVQAEPSAAAPLIPSPSPVGRGGEYFTPSGRSYPFQYELIEAEDAIPSHDPQSFSPNQFYEDVAGMPMGALQDRPYHRDLNEQAKVIEQDRRFGSRFWFMLSDSPDATNGPPIIPSDSNVTLGGNARLMTVLRKAKEQNPEAYNAYRTALAERADQFGLTPAQISDMKAPILVRRLTNVETSDQEGMQTAARESNETFTQALSEKAQAVASGKALSDETITYLSAQLEGLGDESTLRDLFRTAASRELIRRLQADGVFTARTINKYITGDGALNEDGKTLAERAILGRVLPDSDLIDAAAPSTINTIMKTLPALTQLQSRGDLWDVSRHLREAVRLTTDTKLNGWSSVDEYLKQGALFGEQNPNPIAVAIARQFLEAKPTQVKKAFDQFASAANRDVAGQGGFDFIPKQPPWDAFNRIFQADLTPQAYRDAVDPSGSPTPLGEGMQFQARQGRTKSQGGGQPWDLNLGDVQAAFPGQSVLSIPGDGFRVQTRAGYVDLVEVDRIEMGPQERLNYEVGYGQPWNPDVTADGRILGKRGQARIELVKDQASRMTLLHEVEHWLENSGLLTADEIQKIGEATGITNHDAEDRAEWVAKQLNERSYRRDTITGRILDKVWDFIDNLLSLVGFQTTRGILRGIERGDVQNRGDNITRDIQPSQQFAAYKRPANVDKENKLFSEYGSWVNMVPPELAQIFQKRDISFLKQRIDLGTMSELAKQVAESWLENPKRMTARLDEFRLHQRLPSAEEMQALREVGKSQADTLLKALNAQEISEAQYQDLLSKAVGPQSIFTTLTTGMASEWGRIGRMLQEKPPEDRFFDLMAKKRERMAGFLTEQQIRDYEAAFQKVLLEGNADSLERFFSQLQAENPTVWDYMKEFWYGSVLSGFPTWIANFGGNTLWSYFNMGPIKAIEGLTDSSIATWQNRPAQRFMSETLPALAGLTRGLTTGERYKAVLSGMKTGDFQIPGISGLSKMEREMGQFASPWQNATWQLDFPMMRKLGLDVGKTRRLLKNTFGIEPGKPINFMRTVAPWVTLGTRVMVGMDLLGKAAVRDGTIASLTERQIRQELESGSLRPDQVEARRVELITAANSLENALGREMHEAAMVEANKLTFNDPASPIATLILQGRRLPFWGKPLQMIFPFVATPDRLITRAVELIPGVGVLPYINEIFNARGAGTDLTALVARQMAGTVLFAMMVGLFDAGVVTGDVPDDPNERDSFFRRGLQPYSIQVGGSSISYRRFEPLNLVLSIPAVIIPALRKALDRNSEEDVLSLTAYGASMIGRQVLEGSYFTGLQGLIQALGRGASPERQEGSLSRLVDSWVPFSGMRRMVTRTIDAYETEQGAIVRDPQGWFQYVTGASLVTNVRPKYDVFGKPMVIPGNVASQFIPWRVSVANRDPVEQELARFGIFPGPPSQTDSKGKKMPQDQYDFLAQRGGQMVKSRLDRLVGQTFYQSLNPALRELYLRRTIRNAREEVRSELEQRQRAKGFLVGQGG